MNALAKVDQGTNLQLQQRLSPLATVLEHVRIERPPYDEYPVVTVEERQAIPAAISELQRSLEGSSPDHIAAVLGMLSYALPKKHSGGDAQAMLTVYAKTLADIPPDALDQAGLDAVKTLKFFPKVAELRELAAPIVNRRKWQIWVLRRLAATHDEKHRVKPEPLVNPKQLADLRSKIEDRFPSRRLATG